MINKPRIVIFGASRGGISAYHYFKHEYEVIAFADNDNKKHGQSLLGKPVVSAKDLQTMQLDKIVIASLYALQIHRQLVCDEGVDTALITRLPASFFDKAHPFYYAAGFIVAAVSIIVLFGFSSLIFYWLQYIF
ncbi:nucleoside-diphosphate sugar epimerase/dehydratase [Shewanella baltica]|uniref:nucleoside-diphosphate sugar epimerase/dehydratase n=1 Tax=Shewanella baltica TaxID=62322 RepID=UPI003D7B726C